MPHVEDNNIVSHISKLTHHSQKTRKGWGSYNHLHRPLHNSQGFQQAYLYGSQENYRLDLEMCLPPTKSTLI